MSAQNKNKFIYWFSEIGKEDGNVVGGKGANLGEIYNLGVPVPPGFIISSSAYFHFIEKNNLKSRIVDCLKLIDKSQPDSYAEISKKIVSLFINSPIPEEISFPVIKSYIKLGGIFKNTLVAVRSSATAEDLPDASFAGQQKTFLNIRNETDLMESVRECWSSLFEGRSIFYREQKNFDHFKVGLAIPVQKMIQSVSSGVVFTCDPVTGDKTRIIVDAVYGLGEYIVQGMVTPDHYLLDHNNLSIINKTIAEQKIYLTMKNNTTKKYLVPDYLQKRQKISDKQILQVAKIAKKLQEHYFFPQDCEFAVDKKGKVFFVQTRPVTTLNEMAKDLNKEEIQTIKDAKKEIDDKKLILSGLPASPGIGWGEVVLISTSKEIGKVKKDNVMVTSMTTPDFVPAMKKVSAIITDKGGLTSHAAIVSRELGVPCIVGTENATKVLKNGQIVTVDGKEGKVYQGGLKIESNIIQFPTLQQDKRTQQLQKTATKLYVNLADESLADDVAKNNVDGVGLLRAEFMIADIGTHPKKFIEDKKQKIFIDKLTEGMVKFCRAFDPRPVVYRATDFKTNEYRNLKGGELYEPKEPNPMLGFRGAYRYIASEEVFELELEAIKNVRNKFGFKNLWLMIPFVRTPQELMQVKKIVTSKGLIRSSNFQFWMMVEIPSNVILLEDFIKVGIDGISIGSNDLTMLIMGTDRDNSEVASVFDERNPAVMWALERIVKICNKNKITSSICGQGPSQYSELVEKLVEFGITSISVNPDVIERTRDLIYEAESKILNNKK